MTTAEVAKQLRTTDSTVRYWRHRGTGPTGVRVGRRVLYAESDVLAWLESLKARKRRRTNTEITSLRVVRGHWSTGRARREGTSCPAD